MAQLLLIKLRESDTGILLKLLRPHLSHKIPYMKTQQIGNVEANDRCCQEGCLGSL